MLSGITEITSELKKLNATVFKKHWEWVTISIAAIVYVISNFVIIPVLVYFVAVIAAIVSLVYRYKLAKKNVRRVNVRRKT
jgi:predicted solute-binding protein